MMSRQVIQGFFRLDDEQKDEFERYVASPFFNSNKKVIKLVEYLKKCPEKNKKEYLEEKKIYSAISRKKSDFSSGSFNKVLSILLNLLSDYLLHLELKQKKALKALLQINALKNRGLYNRAHHEARQITNPEDNFRTLYQINNYLTDFEDFISSKAENGNAHKLDLNSQQLTHFYLMSRLRIICRMVNHNQLLNRNYKWRSHLTEIRALIADIGQDSEEEMLIHAYFNIVKLLEIKKTPEKHIYKNKYLTETESYLSRLGEDRYFEYQREVYNHLLNFCIFWLNKGGNEYGEYFLALSKLGLKKKYVLKGNTILPTILQSFIANGIRCGETEWAREIMEEYIEYIEDENWKNFILGYYHGGIDDFDRADPFFSRVPSKNSHPAIYLGILTIKIKGYYFDEDKGKFDLKVKELKSWVANKEEKDELPLSYKDAALSFLTHVNKLFKLRDKKIKLSKKDWNTSLTELKEEILRTDSSNNYWLLKELQKLE